MKKIAPTLLGVMLACNLCMPAIARDITGKVMAVYHEPVVVNAKTLDKVSVSVNNCATNQWETASYSPGSVSDDNNLGFLFNDLANAARSVAMKNQFMNSVSGHVTLSVNEQNTIQKTMFWGYNWECGQDLEGKSAPAGGVRTTPAAPVQQKPASPANPLRKFGF